MYLHWSKKLAIGLLAAFAILIVLFVVLGGGEASSTLKTHTTRWVLLNYAGLIIWVFIWIADQARMRSNPVWPWLVPLLLAPLPTLAAFLLHNLRREN